MRSPTFLIVALAISPAFASAADRPDPDAIERGRRELESGSHLDPGWRWDAFKKAGKLWGPDAPNPEADPDGYHRAFLKRYGLHEAPYPNDGLPMGLRKAVSKSGAVGIALDCLVCHGGSIAGKSYVGIGNTTLDLHSLMVDLTIADDRIPIPSPFTINTTRGTVNAGQMSIFLLARRNEDLSFRLLPRPVDTMLPELDPPAWWNMAPKQTMYQDGRTSADSHRSLMQFYLGQFNAREFETLEPAYKDVLAYLKSLDPPAYPLPIDVAKANRGQALFSKSCAKCHGSYNADGPVDYPNVIVELDRIGTDRLRAEQIADRDVVFYNKTWFGRNLPVDEEMTGYQAPPLRGVWATAPYLHNGTAPTLHHVLKSSDRPNRFRRPESTSLDHYDPVRVGWNVEVLAEPAAKNLPPQQARYIVDTERYGLKNSGHAFGDSLSDEERSDLIEYLKTL